MTVFIATFSYGADAAALAALRPTRYDYFQRLTDDGVLLGSGQLLSGSLGDGMVILSCRDEATARTVLDDDPFVREGYVDRLELATWNPTAGTWARG